MKPFIRTYTGKEINPLDVKLDEICIEDIAHGLSLCNRFAGQTKRPISVAQHSVYVTRLCSKSPREIQLQALLHDAPEAILGDITKWLKQTPPMEEFRKIEHDLEKRIFYKFGCPHCMRLEVEEADRIMVYFEGIKGFGPDFVINHPNYHIPTKEEIEKIGPWGFWSWRQSEELFLYEFRRLTNGQ
jgi:uncharacterized protein